MSGFAKLMLVFTSFAPILLTLGFVKFRQGGSWISVAAYAAAAILLTVLCALLLYELSRRIEAVPVAITAVKPADKEIVGFVLAYLLPLVNTFNVTRVDPGVLWFVIGILALVVLTTNTYHVNPLLGLGGYHFYEITAGNIGFILVTRRNIRDVAAVDRVVPLSEYIVLEHR